MNVKMKFNSDGLTGELDGKPIHFVELGKSDYTGCNQCMFDKYESIRVCNQVTCLSHNTSKGKVGSGSWMLTKSV